MIKAGLSGSEGARGAPYPNVNPLRLSGIR